jgi:hypothetical protein
MLLNTKFAAVAYLVEGQFLRAIENCVNEGCLRLIL